MPPRVTPDPNAAGRRSIAPYLLGVVVFQIALLAGRAAFTAVRPRPGAIDHAAAVVRWRRERGNRSADLPPGSRAPRLDLRTPEGRTVNPADFAGRPLAVLFIEDGAG